VHRIGRTGRAQAVGDAITLVSPENAADIRDIQRFIGAKIPELRLEGFNYAPIIARPDQPTQQRRGQRGGGQRGGGYGSGGPRHQSGGGGGGPRQHQGGGGRGSSSGGGGRGEGQQRPAEGSWNRFGASGGGGGGGTGGGRRGR
jgi:ATP-dependent RNA helicase RhlE